jgi:hypothetical protein
MPKSLKSILYFQFCQKNISDLTEAKQYLEDLGVKCGKIHNPSYKVDADYFRFFVSTVSHKDFMDIIYSWHPRKAKQIELRMKI